MNERAAAKRAPAVNQGTTAEPEDELNSSGEQTEEENKRDIEILKTLTVSDANMDQIKEKLVATMSYRLEMMNVNEIDLLENFPYFFTDPSLVI